MILPSQPAEQRTPKEVVFRFLAEVRSGKFPDRARLYMADTVQAHQLNAESPITVKRTPGDYAAHVKEFLQLFGAFELEVTELIAEKDKVYARWVQKGKHTGIIDGFTPTGRELIEFTSAVYRILDGRIAEYWLQTDRFGMEAQLKKNTKL